MGQCNQVAHRPLTLKGNLEAHSGGWEWVKSHFRAMDGAESSIWYEYAIYRVLIR